MIDPLHLFAVWTTWTHPMWFLLGGLVVGTLTVAAVAKATEFRDRLGAGPLLLAVNAIAAAAVALGLVLYLWLGLAQETIIAAYAAGAVVAPVAVYGLVRLVLPRLATIALTTTKEALSQPLFWVALAIGLFAMLIFPFIPYNTFGEDVKMLKDSGLTLIMVLSIMLALWTASVSVSDEIEGRTALTVLSKPVGRRDFILGKFTGICGAVGVMFLVLGVALLVSVSYKVVYDAGENGLPEPEWTVCWAEMAMVVPGLILAFLEACVLTSISVAISTRLPMLPNLLICSSIYVVGHLVPLLVNSAVGDNEIVKFVSRFFAAVLPMLDHFNIQAAISTGQSVPLVYLGWAFVYAAVYCSFAILGALILFEDRDLA